MKLIPIKVPKGFLDAGKYKAVVEKALDTTALAAQSNFETTVDNWKHEVKFHISHTIGERIIGTDDEIYLYVDAGTVAHLIPPIVPKKKKAITILGKGQPKTRPGVMGSGSGSRGKVIATRKRTGPIEHPGTKPRGFSKLIAKKASDRLLLEIHLGFGNIT